MHHTGKQADFDEEKLKDVNECKHNNNNHLNIYGSIGPFGLNIYETSGKMDFILFPHIK